MTTQPGIIEKALPEFISSPGGTAVRLFIDPSDNKAYIKSPSGIITPLETEIVGIVTLIGDWDASGGLFPTVPSPVKKGYEWVISVGGNLGGEIVEPGDLIIAKIDNPGQVTANWIIIENNIGYVPENVANKATDFSVVNNVKYPTTKAVSDYIASVGVSKSVISEFLNTADTSAFVNGTGTAVVRSIAYPVDPKVIDGTSRRVRFICSYSKTMGVTSIRSILQVGPTIINFTSQSMGNGVQNNTQWIFDLYINFRNPDKINLFTENRLVNGATNNIHYRSAYWHNVVWDRTIVNNITLSLQAITGTVQHTLSNQQFTSELLQ